MRADGEPTEGFHATQPYDDRRARVRRRERSPACDWAGHYGGYRARRGCKRESRRQRPYRGPRHEGVGRWPVVSGSMTSRLWCPRGAIPPRLSSARWCRCGPRCGARATTPSRRRWWCATTARPIRSSPRDPRRSAPRRRCRSRRSSRRRRGQTADHLHVAGPNARRVPRRVLPRQGRTVDVPGRRLGRPDRDLAAGRHRQARRRSERIRAVQRPDRRRTAAGARRHRRAPQRYATRSSRRRSSAQAGRPVHPRGRRAVRRGHRAARAVSAARPDHPRRAVRRLGGPARGPLQRLVRAVPPVDRRLGQEGQSGARHVRHRGEGAAAHRQDGLRRGVSAADPPDRQGAPQGPQQFGHRRTRRTSGPRGRSAAKKGGHDAVHPELGTIEDFDDFVTAAPRPRHGGRAGPGAAGRARPSVGQGASRVVHGAARRHHRLCGEPAEEVPGHLPDQLRQRPGGHVQRGAAGGAVLDQPRRQDLPRRQPAHQATELLGVADRTGQGGRPRRAVPRRGVHPARAPVRPGQTRLHAVLQLLHLAHREVGADRVR